MTEILVRVGSWEHETVVGFDPADRELLRGCGLMDGVYAIYMDDTLVVGPQPDGVHAENARDVCKGRDCLTDFLLEFNFTYGLEELPRFAISVMSAEISEGCLEISLPPTHELPWFNTGSMKPDEAREVYLREFRRRLKSAMEHGCQSIRVPNAVRQHISSSAWAQALRDFQTELGGRQ